MHTIEHIVFIIVMIYVGIAVILGAVKYIKKKLPYYSGSTHSYSQLTRRQKQLNKALDKIIEEEAKKKAKSDKRKAH